ncbi:MAG: hypothetical protein KY434_01605 [Actinobacteria bacterium]|nr:hypothetical protein [Actinomycetota bacterium]
MTGRPDGNRPAGAPWPRTAPARRAAPARAVGWLAVAGAAGSAAMSLSHAGVALPVVSALMPGRIVLPPVAAGFAVGAVAFAAVAVGAFRRRPWAWAAGVAVNGLTLTSAAVPFRGVPSALAVAVTLAALGVLASRAGREALRPGP